MSNPSPTARSVRVTVAATKFFVGVAPPGKPRAKDTVPRTYDWRYAPDSPENTAPVLAGHRLTSLADALAGRYRSDAHMGSYYVVDPNGRPLAEQPRICKDGLAWVLDQGFTVEHDLIYVDVDNPLHGEWTEPLRERFDELWATARVLQTTGVYLTRSGYRLMQALDEPVHAGEHASERYLDAWIDELADHGIHADKSCVDWTRLMRLPHVRRGPATYVSPLVDLSRMTPRKLSPKAPAGRPSRSAPSTESLAE